MRSRSTSTLLAGFVVVTGLFSYSLRLVRIQGRSMEPSFSPGQWVLVRQLNWPAVPLRDGDVVVFRHEGQLLIKRIAALQGEKPPVEDLCLPAVPSPDLATRDPWLAQELARLTAPVLAGQLYVLGDNADVSEDSRVFGPIPGSAVIGRVIQWSPPSKRA
jgi:signal peptidase I